VASNGRLLRPSRPDFEVEFTDGGRFTSDEGSWDDVPRGRAIAALSSAGNELRGYARYGFEWEAVARMPIGERRGVPAGGVVVAVRLFGIIGDQAVRLRVTPDGTAELHDLPPDAVPTRPLVFWRGADLVRA
jgi:hypothetical protein